MLELISECLNFTIEIKLFLQKINLNMFIKYKILTVDKIDLDLEGGWTSNEYNDIGDGS